VRPFEIGVVLPIAQFGPERITPRWTDLREMALRAETMGFDTLWTPDELLWRVEDAAPQGMWDGVSILRSCGGTRRQHLPAVRPGRWHARVHRRGLACRPGLPLPRPRRRVDPRSYSAGAGQPRST
jgi:hypothetical protein